MDKRARRVEARLVSDYNYIASTPSTNVLLKELIRKEKLPEFFAVRTSFQSAGKGQAGNSWESERGKNLLFSLLLHPHNIPIEEQFRISQIVSLAIVQVLNMRGVNAKIKWPNDIYVENKKIAGVLIENSLRGNRMEYSIVGVGLNVNQTVFTSDAPNPVSISTILQHKIAVKSLFLEIRNQIITLYTENNTEELARDYHQHLIRNTGFHRYKTAENVDFEAELVRVDSDGRLWLKKRDAEILGFYFKEVIFIF